MKNVNGMRGNSPKGENSQSAYATVLWYNLTVLLARQKLVSLERACLDVSGDFMWSNLRENNTIFLMHLVSDVYARAHKLSRAQFVARDDKYRIVRFISRCPDVFDNMTEDEMVKEVDEYVASAV